MADDATVHETVQDGQAGPLDDRDPETSSIPVASTILSQHIQSVEETAPRRSKTRACYTSLLHQRHLERSENSLESTASAEPDCYTNLLHKPSKRPASPSQRPPHRRRANPPGLIVRGTVFHVRVRVPRKVQATVGRTQVWRSLGTGIRSEAIRKSKLVIADLERSFMAAIGTPAHQATTVEIALAKPVRVNTIPSHSMTFGDLFRHFQADPAKVRAPKTRMIYDGLLWITSSVWGENRSLTSIDRSACRELLEVLRWLPSNPAKRFPSLSAVQAAKMAKKKGLKSTLSPGSINGYMAKLRALMTFAVNEGWIDRNPAVGLTVSDPVRERDKRLPFSANQLRLIFNAPIYRGCVDDEWNYATPGANRPRRARYWIPLIALYSGMRLNEICQLDVADVQNLEGVACFHVRPDPLASGHKRLKTKTSERIVPVHPELSSLGFAAYVASRRSQPSAKLFPELRPSVTGYYSDAFSKWFRRFLVAAGAEAPRTCFHSFRHCFRDALRHGRVEHEVGLALGGWASGAVSDGVSASYGAGFGVGRLYEAISGVTYPNLELGHLR